MPRISLDMNTRPFQCRTCGEHFPIKKLEEHIKKDHFGFDGGIMVLAC